MRVRVGVRGGSRIRCFLGGFLARANSSWSEIKSLVGAAASPSCANQPVLRRAGPSDRLAMVVLLSAHRVTASACGSGNWYAFVRPRAIEEASTVHRARGASITALQHCTGNQNIHARLRSRVQAVWTTFSARFGAVRAAEKDLWDFVCTWLTDLHKRDDERLPRSTHN